MNYLCDEIIKLIKATEKYELPKMTLKNEFIAVVGILHGNQKKYTEILKQKRKGISVEFFDELEKIKNGSITDRLKSERCIGIVWGQTPHSMESNPVDELEYKSVGALMRSGQRKLTVSSFPRAVDELITKIKI